MIHLARLAHSVLCSRSAGKAVITRAQSERIHPLLCLDLGLCRRQSATTIGGAFYRLHPLPGRREME